MSRQSGGPSGRFATFRIAITVLNILGHAFFGFEQSLAHPWWRWFPRTVPSCCSSSSTRVATAVRLDSWVAARASSSSSALGAHHRARVRHAPLRKRETWTSHASVVAICSKCLLRAPAGNGTRHFLNPSNFGITVTLLVFAWVSIAPPYQFTENMTGVGDWILPAVIVCTGTFLNARFTHRLPLIAAWLGGFVAQAALRSLFLDTPSGAALVPMTGVAFILYTFYMVTDPATTPSGRREQIVFGLSVAAVYGLLMVSHVVFGLFLP